MALHLISSGLASATALLFVVALYLSTLHRFGGERFKNAVSWAQIGLVAGIYAGMQLLPAVLREYLPADFFDRRSPWLALFPPAWFGALVEVGLGRAFRGLAGNGGPGLGGTAPALGLRFETRSRRVLGLPWRTDRIPLRAPHRGRSSGGCSKMWGLA